MMREVGISLLAVAGFGLALWRCRIVAVTENVVSLSLAGLMSMLDAELDDRAKEVAVRRAGLDLIVTSVNILWRLGLALGVAALPILLADDLDLVSRDSVFALMSRVDYIVAVSAVSIGLVALIQRWRPAATEDVVTVDRYSNAERFFHALAFSSPRVLKAVSRMEDRLTSQPVQEAAGPPIFVTSLARAGTTAVLNALHDVSGVATHTYRDMPFLTAPRLWNRLAGGKRRRVDRHERAHGDGLEIDLDSPEAFEEVIWKMFWPEKFEGSEIALWRPEDRKEEAETFFGQHMEKVIRTRLRQGRRDLVGVARYCSKNNANIARLPYLAEAFDGCHIVVPVRRPECHAASLLRQHNNFLALQTEDDFVRRYMRDIGHFEFGLIHKPIGFPGFDPERYDPATGDYWLRYWIDAFREVLDYGPRCILVTQDDLRASPQKTMTHLVDALGLPHAPSRFADYLRSGPDEAPTDCYDQQLYDEASELYRELEAIAVS